MLVGILAGLATGALWGLTFVAPRAVRPFTELDLAVSRYALFGLISLALMLAPRFRPARLTPRLVGLSIFLGGVGYVAYYILAAYAVRLAGVAIPPLVIGALPIALAIVGNWSDPQVRWSRLILPLAMISAGLLVVNLSALGAAETPLARLDILLGTLCAVSAFTIWMAYGIVNSRVMLARDAPDTMVWTGLQGVGALICSIPLVPVALFSGSTAFGTVSLTSTEGLRFLAWSLLLGSAGSWLATWLWIYAARRLPLALSAQLIVTETLFALLYGFLYDRRWPSLAEASGAALLIAGVAIGVRLFRTVEPDAEPRP